jgi:hypothetical protein
MSDNKEITVLRPGARLPAARKLATDWRAFTRLMFECDRLVKVREGLHEHLDELRNRRPCVAPDLDVADAELTEATKAEIERCKQTLKRFDRPELYEENDNEEGALKLEGIIERVALMLGCVDTGPTSTEPEAFVRMLVTHIHDSEISYPALLSGCRAIEQDKKPVRSIGYVLEVLQEHQVEWIDRRMALYWIESTANRLRDAIVEAQAKLLLEQAEEEVQKRQHTVNVHVRLLEHYREGCEKDKRAAIEAHHKYQHSRLAVIREEQVLSEMRGKLAAAKADRAKLLDRDRKDGRRGNGQDGGGR